LRTIEPIAHWTKKDILRFTEKKNIPLNPLYARGHQNILCEICQHHQPREKEIYSAKDAEKIVERLESLGYF